MDSFIWGCISLARSRTNSSKRKREKMSGRGSGRRVRKGRKKSDRNGRTRPVYQKKRGERYMSG
jgi:hypothetical protein